MAKVIMEINAEDIDDLFATLRRSADHLMGAAPARDPANVLAEGEHANEPALVKDEGLANALVKDEGLANALVEGEKVKRGRRTKAETEADKQPVAAEKDEAGPEAGQPKGNGEAPELTLVDVREAVNRALSRDSARADEIKARIQEQFGVKVLSNIPPERFAEAVAVMDAF